MRGVAALLALAILLAVPAAAEPARMEAGETLRGHFVQERHLTGFSAPVRSEGSFLLAPGRGLVWRAENPFPVTTVVTPAGLVQSVGGAETMRLPSARLPFLAKLYDMLGGALAGDWRAMEAEFAVAREPAGKSTRVTLTPRQQGDGVPIKAIVLKLGRFVDEVDIVKPDGDFDHLTFTDQALSRDALRPDEASALDQAAR